MKGARDISSPVLVKDRRTGRNRVSLDTDLVASPRAHVSSRGRILIDRASPESGDGASCRLPRSYWPTPPLAKAIR
jgi:hypothetical protein